METFGGKVFVRWDAEAAVTAFAPVAYFLEFLKANGLWQQWVEDCPLNYRSGNASEVRTRLDCGPERVQKNMEEVTRSQTRSKMGVCKCVKPLRTCP